MVRVSYELHDVTGDVVRLSETMSGSWWDEPRAEPGALRFLAPDRLTAFLDEAGFTIEHQYGDWDSTPLTDTSAEIVTIARRR